MRSLDLNLEIEYTQNEVIAMADYKKMDITLFNACTDAVRRLQRMKVGSALDSLIQAQRETEERYICGQEGEEMKE